MCSISQMSLRIPVLDGFGISADPSQSQIDSCSVLLQMTLQRKLFPNPLSCLVQKIRNNFLMGRSSSGSLMLPFAITSTCPSILGNVTSLRGIPFSFSVTELYVTQFWYIIYTALLYIQPVILNIPLYIKQRAWPSNFYTNYWEHILKSNMEISI